MEMNAAYKIKTTLENTYDIPFDVVADYQSGDPQFKIRPAHSEQELFEVTIRFKNQLRLIIEIEPEKYAAFSIKDMASSSLEKKELFVGFAEQLESKRAKVDFYINNIPQNILSYQAWPSEWTNYHIRISRSPITSEDEQYLESEIAASWACIVVGMMLSLLNIIQVDVERMEGGVKSITVNRYERNPLNRELCLTANGYKCKICGFDFEEKYGVLGHHFIHVHHIIPVSKNDDAYLINPAVDLIPVCPNCHAMLHKCDPPILPEELRRIIESQKQADN